MKVDKYGHIKELLNNYRTDEARIVDLNEQIESYEELACDGSIQGIDYSRDKISSGRISNPTESIAIDIDMHCKVMENEKKRLERNIKRVDNALNQLTEEQSEVLRLRYIDRNSRREQHTFNEVSKILHNSRWTCQRLHDKALEKMNEVIYKG